MYKFDRVRAAVKNYLAQDNKDFSITFNLAELLDATLEDSARLLITRFPKRLATVQNYRAISVFARRILFDGGLLVFVGTTDSLPASSYVKEFDFVTSTRITTTGETVFVFEKPCKWLQKRRINASLAFKDYQSLIANLTKDGEVIIDPFQQELCIADEVAAAGCAFIGANAAADDIVASMVVRS